MSAASSSLVRTRAFRRFDGVRGVLDREFAVILDGVEETGDTPEEAGDTSWSDPSLDVSPKVCARQVLAFFLLLLPLATLLRSLRYEEEASDVCEPSVTPRLGVSRLNSEPARGNDVSVTSKRKFRQHVTYLLSYRL